MLRFPTTILAQAAWAALRSRYPDLEPRSAPSHRGSKDPLSAWLGASDREDLLQQVFLELYRALPRFRADSSIGTFIHGIAVHVAIDHLRRRRRRPRDFTAAELDELLDGSPSPEDHARQRGELGRVLALLERIKPDKRVAFALVAIGGLSLDQAAVLLDASADVIKQRVLRARRELLAMLARTERSGRSTR